MDSTTDQQNLTLIYANVPPSVADYKFFSIAQGTVSKINHVSPYIKF